MFWDNVAWVYDIFADGINRKALQIPDGDGLLRKDACAHPEEVRALSACAV